MEKNKLNPPKLTLECCTSCPFFERVRVYTSDSWEEGYDWLCKKEPEKKIAGFVEWNDKKPEIPEWCPLREPEHSLTVPDIRNKLSAVTHLVSLIERDFDDERIGEMILEAIPQVKDSINYLAQRQVYPKKEE
jgi:hypothetical protein